MPTFVYNGDLECRVVIDARTKKEAMQKLVKGEKDIRLENIWYGSSENIICEEDFAMTDYYGNANQTWRTTNSGKKHKHITGENDENV